MSALKLFRSCLIALLVLGMFSTAALAAPKKASPRTTPELPAQSAGHGDGDVPDEQPVEDGVENPATSASLDVLTYNIHFGIGVDGVFDLERIAQVIEASGAEVIGLQEVDRHYHSRSNWMDVPGWLADRLGMHVAYGANIDLPPLEAGQPRRQYGNAVLSTYPITSSTNVPLPNYGSEQRGALDVALDVDGTAIRVVNTHLSHWSFEERHAQTTAIAELLGTDLSSTLVLGDFNARPDAVEMSPLQGVLTDIWTLVPHDDDGFTYPSTSPTARIDYIFGSPDVGSGGGATITSLASDHLPVVSAITLG